MQIRKCNLHLFRTLGGKFIYMRVERALFQPSRLNYCQNCGAAGRSCPFLTQKGGSNLFGKECDGNFFELSGLLNLVSVKGLLKQKRKQLLIHNRDGGRIGSEFLKQLYSNLQFFILPAFLESQIRNLNA